MHTISVFWKNNFKNQTLNNPNACITLNKSGIHEDDYSYLNMRKKQTAGNANGIFLPLLP